MSLIDIRLHGIVIVLDLKLNEYYVKTRTARGNKFGTLVCGKKAVVMAFMNRLYVDTESTKNSFILTLDGNPTIKMFSNSKTRVFNKVKGSKSLKTALNLVNRNLAFLPN